LLPNCRFDTFVRAVFPDDISELESGQAVIGDKVDKRISEFAVFDKLLLDDSRCLVSGEPGEVSSSIFCTTDHFANPEPLSLLVFSEGEVPARQPLSASVIGKVADKEAFTRSKSRDILGQV